MDHPIKPVNIEPCERCLEIPCRCTAGPCPGCGREVGGHWFAPCPSDDCPSNARAAR